MLCKSVTVAGHHLAFDLLQIPVVMFIVRLQLKEVACSRAVRVDTELNVQRAILFDDYVTDVL